ncbi:MAG TPA: hypothetical protein VET69_07875 [Terriglobales bacterium]|jgi:hypothetical protein|nr:hypothetical protein [Terriglobales bacterium]
MALNKSRIWLGGFVGGIAWVIWGMLVNVGVGQARYEAAQAAGFFLKQPRYPFFFGQWIVVLFILAFILAHLYAWARSTLGPGPRTALLIGLLVGFAAGFPTNFGTATWAPFSRVFPLGWMVELWGGAVIATLIAGALYKEA